MNKKDYIIPDTNVSNHFVISQCLCGSDKVIDFEGGGSQPIGEGEGDDDDNFTKERGNNDFGNIW